MSTQVAAPMEIYQPDAQVGDLKLWRAPEEVLIEAQQAAVALQKRIAGKAKPVILNGQQYIESDDWQMLANFFGYSTKIESTEKFEFDDVRGFKACAVLIHEHTGRVVGRGEALCLDEEDNWGERTKYEWQDVFDAAGKKIADPSGRGNLRHRVEVGKVSTPLFQLMSMAQTRACNKAMSNKLRWVVALAGYATTPAEDMHEATMPLAKEKPVPLPTEIKKKPVGAAPLTPQSSQPVQRQAPAPRSESVRCISEAQARRFYAKWKEAGWSGAEVDQYLMSTFGIKNDRSIPVDRYEEVCHWADNRL